MQKKYQIKGIVIHGDKRGKQLGYPTANVALDQEVPEGIYAALVTVGNDIYQSATFVGPAKTFHKKEPYVESFLFDFDRDIYGEEIVINLYDKVRENEAFTTVDALIEKMKQDVETIKEYFSSE